MRKIAYPLIAIACVLSLALSQVAIVSADSNDAPPADAPSQVIINEVKLGGQANADPIINNIDQEEYFTLFNASGVAVTLDGWQLEYAKTSNAVQCGSSNWGVSSSQITELTGTLQPDQLSSPIIPNGTLNRALNDNVGGSLQLVDSNGVVQDLVGWGSASSPAPCSETAPAQIPTDSQSVERYLDCTSSFPVDTDNNALDFMINPNPNPANLSDQYAASCQQDSGQNVEPATTCDGIIINELLPNPDGSDAGNEFIELYNPTLATVTLDGCSLQTSANSKTYTFSGVTLQPGQYQAFYDSQTGLTLPNAAGGEVWLLSSPAEDEELQDITYPTNMADGVAWAFFTGGWAATYTPTPNAANILQSSEPCPIGQYRDTATNRCRDVTSESTTLVPCNANQVRNPATNRCRAIVSGSTLTPCQPGQYRNPATNRCKSTATASSTLKPCKPGQERNPETNRCKSTTSTTSLKSCQAGQERNPATNRCRKVTATSLASIRDVNTPSTAAHNTQWLLAAGAVLAAAAYAAYEWRHEIILAVAKFRARFSRPAP